MPEDKNLLTKEEWAIFMSGPSWTNEVEAAFDSERTREAYELHVENTRRSYAEKYDAPSKILNAEDGR